MWKTIPGFTHYEASDSGEIRSVDRFVMGRSLKGRVLKQQQRPDGYRYVSLFVDGVRKSCKVHRLVALAFIPNPDGLPLVDHKRGTSAGDGIGNLTWATHVSNGLNRQTTFGVSGVLGVFPSASKRNPWRALIQIDGVNRHLGVFPTIEAASAARAAALTEVLNV